MTVLENYVNLGRKNLRLWLQQAKGRTWTQLVLGGLAGFCLSAASLGGRMLPLCLAVLCAGLPGWMPLAFAGGGALGYWMFWGRAGLQALFYLAAGLPVCLLVTKTKLGRTMPLLQPAASCLIVAASGVIFQLWQGDDTPIIFYLLRLGLAFGVTWLCQLYRDRREPVAEWVLISFGVLSLAQMAPLPWLDLGMVAGAVTVAA